MRNMQIISLLRKTWSGFSRDKGSGLAASMAYYTVFSLAPLLILSMGIAGLFLGQDAVQGHLQSQIGSLIGQQAGEAVEAMIAAAYRSERSVPAMITGAAVLFIGATGLFVHFQGALDQIWNIRPVGGSYGWLQVLISRWLSFAMVAVIGFVLLVSLFFSAFLSFITGKFAAFLTVPPVIIEAMNFFFSFFVTAFLFAVIFKILPNVHCRWRDVWPGAIFTSALFSAGRYLIGLYLGRAAVDSGYGAAGSLVIIMIWSYYTSLIVLLGAEFTQVYAAWRGHRVEPRRGFEYLPPAIRNE